MFGEKDIPPEYTNIITDLNTTQIIVNRKLTKDININVGICRGDSLSPLLFNTLMNKLIEYVNSKINA